MKNRRVISFMSLTMSACFFICWIFWKQEIQYALPTPVPANLVKVNIGDTIDLTHDLKIHPGRPVLLHFFNAACPCSRFNMREFESMAHRYKDLVQFYVVLQSDDKNSVAKFKEKYDLNVPVILDDNGIISDKCGIYSTPQAVLLDKASAVYFKGNYNASRYCTRKETKFVEIALDSLVENKPLPLFVHNVMTEPYGCTLPSDENDHKDKIVLNLF